MLRPLTYVRNAMATTGPVVAIFAASMLHGLPVVAQSGDRLPRSCLQPVATQAPAWRIAQDGVGVDLSHAGQRPGIPTAMIAPLGETDLCQIMNAAITGQEILALRPVMVDADAPGTVPPQSDEASLAFPMVVEPGETVPVTYTGPLNAGDWVDIITAGDDANMTGGWSWAYVDGAPVSLTAPMDEGDYTLRYVTEDPRVGRIALVSETLVVRAAPTQRVPADEIIHRCEGPGLTPCEILLPDDDIALTLLPGYGLTEPLVYVTPAGAAATRPSFDVVRLADGAPVVLVNARQAQAVSCQDSLAGDVMCVTDAVTETDAVAVAFVLGSLTSAAMASEMTMMGEDEASIAPGPLQGIWFAHATRSGQLAEDDPVMMIELFQDDGAEEVFGYFVTSPHARLAQVTTGDITGRLDGERLALTLAAGDGTPLLRFKGVASADMAYQGDMVPVGGSPVAVVLARIAGPGEDWTGPEWMTGADDRTTGALPLGQSALDGLQGDERAVAELLGALMGTVAGAGVDPAAPAARLSPTLAPLGGVPVDLQGMPAEALMDLILPFQRTVP